MTSAVLVPVQQFKGKGKGKGKEVAHSGQLSEGSSKTRGQQVLGEAGRAEGSMPEYSLASTIFVQRGDLGTIDPEDRSMANDTISPREGDIYIVSHLCLMSLKISNDL